MYNTDNESDNESVLALKLLHLEYSFKSPISISLAVVLCDCVKGHSWSLSTGLAQEIITLILGCGYGRRLHVEAYTYKLATTVGELSFSDKYFQKVCCSTHFTVFPYRLMYTD